MRSEDGEEVERKKNEEKKNEKKKMRKKNDGKRMLEPINVM